MKTGLVLEGGGIRGIFSAGVIDVLMEEGVKFDGGIGVSAGAAFGSNYKSGQNRRAIRYNLRFAKDPRYSSIRSLIATGNLFNAQFCYHDIPEKLDPFDWETFRKNPMDFYLVCTDAETGEPVYHLCDCDKEEEWEMLEWFRASGSMPLVSRVVEVGGKKLLDGGVADSIPLKFMEEQGFGRNLVILTRPADYIKKPNTMMPVIRRALRSYPAMVDAMEKRHVMYNEELAHVRRREAEGFAYVIRPARDLDVGRVEHDRMKIRAAYKEGRRMARRLLPDIRRFLAGAQNEAGTIKPSMIEEDVVEVSKVVKTSLVEDPTLNKPEEAPAKGHALQGEAPQTSTQADALHEEAGQNSTRVYGLHEGAPQTSAQTDALHEEAGQTENFREIVPAESLHVEPASQTAPAESLHVESTSKTVPDKAPADEAPVEKVRVKEVRSVLVGEPEDEPSPFERPFPGDRAPDLPVEAPEIMTAGKAKEAPAAESRMTAEEAPSAENKAIADEAAASSEPVPAEETSVAENEAIADEAAAAEATEAPAAAVGSSAQTAAGAGRPTGTWTRKKKQKKSWKPGQMTSLKQRMESEE